MFSHPVSNCNRVSIFVVIVALGGSLQEYEQMAFEKCSWIYLNSSAEFLAPKNSLLF
jgi:hypothetical protein